MTTASDCGQHDLTERVVRVFISSTFRDMHAERDYLGTVTFPQLRRLCEARGVTWGEVDLRWGVTDEAAAEGKVLPICLKEIQRCRPYFIGLLGERYGWMPESIPDELLEAEGWIREQLAERKSLTELEILHGVLRDPAMAEHAFFYFRDPAWLDHLPAGVRREDFVSEDDASAEKLHQLKQRIRGSGLPVREHYPTPEALGPLVLADLMAVIDRRFPEESQPDPLTRDAMDHAAYARSRERVYIGRPGSFTRLDSHVAGSGDQPLVILGESGSGKSALLANWAARYRQAHPDAFILEHYIGATPASADWAVMLRRILGEFRQRLGLAHEIPGHPDALRSAFQNWLHMAAGKGRVILILDALNQLEDRDGAPDLLWLPPVMPDNARLIVSTLPGRALDAITARGWPVFRVEPLSVDERKTLIRVFLSDCGRSLSPARVDRIAGAPQSGNPLYLRVLLDELRLFGHHERLEERIAYYLEAASPYELYEKVISRWEDSYEGDTDLVGDTLSLLWAARRGLSESELLDALGRDGRPLPRAAWSPLFLAMADALVSRGGLLTCAHDFLRTAARDAYLPTETHQQQAHTRLADYFERRPVGPRRTDELPWQLAEARAWQRLYHLLADRVFFNDAWDCNQFEVKTRWAQVESNSTSRMLEAYHSQIERPEAEVDKDFLSRLSLLLADTGHGEEAMAPLKEGERVCRQSGSLDGLQNVLGSQAAILLNRGDLDGATTLLEEQERICQQLGDLHGLSHTLGNRAVIATTRGDLDGAMALHQEEERICRRLGDPHGLSRSLGNQALIAHTRGDLDGAMALLREQERICRQLGDLDGLQAALGNQSLIPHTRGDLDGAMALLREQERICRQLGNLHFLRVTLGNQGVLLQVRGDLDGAMALHQEEERICRQLGDLLGLARTLNNQAVYLMNRGDLDGAMALLEEQERICRQLDNLEFLQAALCNQALVLRTRGEPDAAMALLKEGERICRQLGDLHSLQATLGIQSAIRATRGDLEGAMALLKEQEQVCQRVGILDGLQNALGDQAIILHARGDLDGAMALHKEKERICQQMGNVQGLVRSLANQALVLQDMGCERDGVPLAEEAHRLAANHGFEALAAEAYAILIALRQAAQHG